ncbi:MAG: CobW family GTP-binding protein [Lachnospiraceae bacterium]|jgi:G3E family GTPase
MAVKVDIISGFLGAGKTTLIRKLIKDALSDEQVVLIENEFGEIGIDGGFLADAGIKIREMNSGCICCSLVGDFGTALKEVVAKYHPDRIMIEPSGVGKLSDVMAAVTNLHDDDLVINSASTVADAQKVKMYMKNFGEFFNNQIQYAGTIILSRTQLISQDKLDKAVAMIREQNPKATIITTPWDDLDGKQILDAMEGIDRMELDMLEEAAEKAHAEHEAEHHHHHHHDHDEHDEHDHDEHDHDHDDDDHDEHDHDHDHEGHEHHHHHDADDVFSSWGQETAKKYTKEQITEILRKLSGDSSYGVILRAKGMLPTPDGKWLFFDMVPGEADVRDGSAEVTGKIVVIGSELKEDKLKELFEV